jgi:hypothetical protein
MRKLKLESLQVQSFTTTDLASSARGTVRAREDETADCRLSRDGGVCLSWDPAVCMETGGDCNLVTGPVESCLC